MVVIFVVVVIFVAVVISLYSKVDSGLWWSCEECEWVLGIHMVGLKDEVK